jgi:regulator of replication initiation timing
LNVNKLLEKCRVLLAENHSLREENEILKARLGITDPPRPEPPQNAENQLPLVEERIMWL